MLNKSIALFAAFTTALVITGTAEAGGCHGGGYSSRVRYSTPSPSYQAELKAKQAAQARAVAAKRKKQIEIAEARAVQAAKRKQIAAAEAKAEAKAAAKAEAVAEAKVETKTETVAEVASEVTTASTAAEQKVASIEKTCSKFIPATGTTVEVECAKE